MLEHASKKPLFVQGLGQSPLKLFGSKRLDQVIIRGEFGHGNDITIGAFGSDQHIHRRQRNQMLLTQLLKQLLAVTAIVQRIVGQNNIEGIGFDLSQNLGR